MRTTINLEPTAYRLARALATQRGESLGRVLSEAILGQFGCAQAPSQKLEIDAFGFPVLYLARPITPEEVEAAIEEE